MMIARVDFESLWTNFYDPSAPLDFFVSVFFFSDLQFFPEHTQLNFTGGTSSVSTS